MGVSGVGEADGQGLAHWGPTAKVGKADSGDCGHCGKGSLKVLWGGADPISDIRCTPPAHRVYAQTAGVQRKLPVGRMTPHPCLAPSRAGTNGGSLQAAGAKAQGLGVSRWPAEAACC